MPVNGKNIAIAAELSKTSGATAHTNRADLISPILPITNAKTRTAEHPKSLKRNWGPQGR